MNYMNLNQYPIQLSFIKNRTNEFEEIYHAHQGMELLYVHKGSGNIISDGVLTEIKDGSLYCFRPFHIHRIKIDIEKGPYIRSLFVFEPSVLIKYLQPFQSLHMFFYNLWKQPLIQTVFTGIPDDKLKYLIDDHEKEVNSLTSLERLESEAYFLVSIIHLLSLHASKSDLTSPIKSVSEISGSIPLILDWLENHFNKDFQLDKISKAVHLSPNYISYIFHKVTGSSIGDYLAARRIQEACSLLRTSSLNIQEIGYRIGFSNFSYFCRFFKKHIGMTPNQFRQSQVGSNVDV